MGRQPAVTIFEKMARTRGQKLGHLFERSGSWLGRYWVDSADEIDPKTGKAKRERVTVTIAASKGAGAIGKREARKLFQDEWLARVNSANMRPSSAKPLADFIEARFYPDYLPTLKPSGQLFYRHILERHVVPILGKVKLRDISVERVQALLTLKGRAGLSTQTVVHIRNCLSAVIRHAKAMGWYFDEIPTTGVRLPEMKRDERQAPTWDQVCLLVQNLPEPCATLVLFLTLGGLRIGEAMGLRIKHLNLTGVSTKIGVGILPPHTMAVVDNYVRNQYTTPKTKGSVRLVPIPAWFIPRLAALLRRESFTDPDSPVFVATNGRPLDQHNLAARVLKPTARALKMDWISWHCFRHGNSTFADQGGMSVAERQKILGHATSAMAMHYTHADLNRMRERLELMVDPTKLTPKPADFGQQSGQKTAIMGDLLN